MTPRSSSLQTPHHLQRSSLVCLASLVAGGAVWIYTGHLQGLAFVVVFSLFQFVQFLTTLGIAHDAAHGDVGRVVMLADESREILIAARRAGLLLKLHADELSSSGGAELAAELDATSADHLGAISEAGIAALASSGTVATLLPATMLFLGKSAQAPARRMLDAALPIALATDFNPGTSPTVGLPLVLTLAVSQLRMSAAEAITAATVNGAAALGLADRVGQIAPGLFADLALMAISDYRELPYWLGARVCRKLWTRGKACEVYDLDVT